ncbi:RING finger protein [Paludisphaera sp.]|uniref:RING finger protein n=1 Tax=Paludisphaera sp. TaxID=2017432 RepID=UPI00301B74A7
MSLLGFAFLALMAYGSLRLIAKAVAWATGSRYLAFRRLAARHRGRYETRGLADSPIVSFPQGEDLVRVGLAPAPARGSGVLSTRIVVRFRRGIPFRLDMLPVGSPRLRQLVRGTEPVAVGDREFDNAFVVRANDADMARDFLGPGVRWSIHGLQRLVRPGGLSLAISPERLLVQIDRDLSNDPEALFTAVAETLAVHEGLRAGVRRRISEGVTVLEGDGGPDPDEGPPVCKVCGEAVVEGQATICDTCGAPHHRDCWEFVGWCSIYGCGGKVGRSTPASAFRSTTPAPPPP